MPEIKDIIYYIISIIGIIVTGFFSYQLYKVSKLTVEATKVLANNDRNRMMIGKIG